MNIHVLANYRRPPIITEDLNKQGLSYHVHMCPDYEFPPNWSPHPEFIDTCPNHVGALRCLRGHQDILRECSPGDLIFEDDARIMDPKWWSVVQAASKLLAVADVVILHGRDVDFDHWEELNLGGILYWMPRHNCWEKVSGSTMAYFIGEEARLRMLTWQYIGRPADWLLVDGNRVALIDPSPFAHDRRYGSIVEGVLR